MLMESDVDPFDAQEAKPYKSDPDVKAMTDLVAAYQRNDISEFEKVLKSNRWVPGLACAVLACAVLACSHHNVWLRP